MARPTATRCRLKATWPHRSRLKKAVPAGPPPSPGAQRPRRPASSHRASRHRRPQQRGGQEAGEGSSSPAIVIPPGFLCAAGRSAGRRRLGSHRGDGLPHEAVIHQVAGDEARVELLQKPVSPSTGSSAADAPTPRCRDATDRAEVDATLVPAPVAPRRWLCSWRSRWSPAPWRAPADCGVYLLSSALERSLAASELVAARPQLGADDGVGDALGPFGALGDVALGEEGHAGVVLPDVAGEAAPCRPRAVLAAALPACDDETGNRPAGQGRHYLGRRQHQRKLTPVEIRASRVLVTGTRPFRENLPAARCGSNTRTGSPASCRPAPPSLLMPGATVSA